MVHDQAAALLADIRATRARIDAELQLPIARREGQLPDDQLRGMLRAVKRQEREATRMVA